MLTKIEHSWSIKTSSDTFVVRERMFRILPKEKFIRKKDKRIQLYKKELGVYKLDVPFTFKDVKRSRSWLGDGMQCDDIPCYEEWTEKVKVYDKELLEDFVRRAMDYHNITEETLITL